MLEGRLLRCSTIFLLKRESSTLYQHFCFLSSRQHISASTLRLEPDIWPDGATNHAAPRRFVITPDSAEAKSKTSTRSVIRLTWHRTQTSRTAWIFNSLPLHWFITGNHCHATQTNVDKRETPQSATVSTVTKLGPMHRNSLVFIRVVVIETLALGDERSLQNHLSLLVSLVVLRRELVDPAEFRLAVLAWDVAHHVTTSEHHAVLHVTEVQIDDAIEEKRSSCRARETCWDQLGPIRQRNVTAGAGEQARATQVVQKDSPHLSAL